VGGRDYFSSHSKRFRCAEIFQDKVSIRVRLDVISFDWKNRVGQTKLVQQIMVHAHHA
jgi:hypothetical protein